MAVFGFIVGFAFLAYLTFCIVVLTIFTSLIGSGKGAGWFMFIGSIVVIYLWYLLFTYAPFTIAIT